VSSGTGQAEGVVVVDKPAGWTSHDVVARMRRLAGTRRVGHAGTLDPMATGVLVLGVGRATKLLGHVAAGDKAYTATIRLGQSTTTDDAEGEVVSSADASALTLPQVRAAALPLTGAVAQVPATVSAIKVRGERAYAVARAGREVTLAARPVTVSRFDLAAPRVVGSALDVDAEVVCSAGTYVRALARDLGAALGVGGHLTALRRTRVGPWTLDEARTLDQLAKSLDVVPLPAAAARALPRWDVDAASADRVRVGARLPLPDSGPGPWAVFGPGDELLALAEERAGRMAYLVVLAARG
jgi:tRNA pseudouridine55 synthase